MSPAFSVKSVGIPKASSTTATDSHVGDVKVLRAYTSSSGVRSNSRRVRLDSDVPHGREVHDRADLAQVIVGARRILLVAVDEPVGRLRGDGRLLVAFP